MKITIFTLIVFLALSLAILSSEERPRMREFGIITGILDPGEWNAITDVEGIKVGHVTLIEGQDIRTGVTAILPHGGNIYQEKVPGAMYVANGYGKLTGNHYVYSLAVVQRR